MNNPICIASGDQTLPQISTDGAGGAIIVWEDRRGDGDIYAQRIDVNGYTRWADDGIPVLSGTGDQTEMDMAADGEGGVYVVCVQEDDVYIQRVDSSGNLLWGPGGLLVAFSPDDDYSPKVAVDPQGGVHVIWGKYTTYGYELYWQYINPDGVPRWPNGYVVVDLVDYGFIGYWDLVPTNPNNLCVANVYCWDDGCEPYWEWYTGTDDPGPRKRLPAAPTRLSHSQITDMIPNGQDGATIVWYDCAPEQCPEGERYLGAATTGGTAPSWNISIDRVGDQKGGRVVRDNLGGYYISWEDNYEDIYAQRVDSLGQPQWSFQGVPVCDASYQQRSIGIASDGGDGAIIGWLDARSVSEVHVYAQRMNSAGEGVWENNGIPITTAGIVQNGPAILKGPSGGAILAWSADREGSVNVYCQNVSQDGVIGGLAWTSQTSGTNQILFGVDFSGRDTGWVVGQMGIILRTTNGGDAWMPQTSGTVRNLRSVAWTDQLMCTIVGGNGTILRTTDGGELWSSQLSGTTNALSGIDFTRTNVGTAVGELGTILRTTNGGMDWEVRNGPTALWLHSVSFADDSVGLIVGDGGIIVRTTDTGENWTVQTSGTSATLYSVWMTSVINATVVGASGTILNTTDGGLSWLAATSGVTDTLYAVEYADEFYGTSVGTGGLILRTTNGGASWQQNASPSQSDLHGISFGDFGYATVVGWNGTILRTSTGGTGLGVPVAPDLISPSNGSASISVNTDFVWSEVPLGYTYRIEIAEDDTFSALVEDEAGLTGTSFRSSSLEYSTEYFWRVNAANPSGISDWSESWSFTTLDIPPQVVLIAPGNGEVLSADTVRYEWQELVADMYWHEMSTDSLFLVSTIDSSLTTAWVTIHELAIDTPYWWRVRARNEVGWGVFSEVWTFSVVLTDVDDAHSRVPNTFSLSQNYPNPFNPTTTIRYGLPQKVRVRLEAFNLLGEGVALLVDGEQEAGWHEVEFTKKNLASGLYLYRITAGEFVETRKLVLLR